MLIFFVLIAVGIRITADCGTQNFQYTRKLKWATTLEFTTISAIIFIHCCRALFFFLYPKIRLKIVFSATS